MDNKPKPNNRSTGPRAPRAPRAPRPEGQGASGAKAPRQMGSSRGEAIRAQRRSSDMATKLASEHLDAQNNPLERRANFIAGDKDKLRVTFLGGQDGIGEKNMQVIEYGDDALILDCGFNLGLELPGVNYSIPDTTYLESIKHKIRGYVISHGHLDHVGALKHIVPMYPAPVYGSRYTIGVVEQSFENAAADTGLEFRPSTVVMNMDAHEKLKLGVFFIELVRITHSIPESNCIVVETPVGKIINTGDFRLDPEPLDEQPSDIARLQELGEEGVLLLMSESTNSYTEGRTPTEHTLQQSFHDVITQAEGRVFVSIFSSNMNRIQMIVNAAVAANRRVALEGRSMMSYAEIAVRQGLLKIPKGYVLPMREMPNIPDEQVLIVCTGGQGESGSALQRMSIGEHKHIKLKESDTVVVSSTPIPGNELTYQQIGNDIVALGAKYVNHIYREVYGVGPLHVSGHGFRGEQRDMIRYIKPKFFLPIYAGQHNRKLHFDLAIEEGIPRSNVLTAENGDSYLFTPDKAEYAGQVPHGSVLVDQSGNVVSNVVVKDRIMLSESGLVAVILTVDKKSGQLLTSPDIVTRGFIYIRDNEELMTKFRAELRRAVMQRFKRIDLDRFKAEIKDHVTHFLYDETGRTPIVIPVVNVVGGKPEGSTFRDGESRHERSDIRSDSRGANRNDRPSRGPRDNFRSDTQVGNSEPIEESKSDQQKRFQEMRAKLLGSDQPD
jgi:ribonuclease J